MQYLTGEEKQHLHLHSTQTHRRATAQMKVRTLSIFLIKRRGILHEMKLSLCLWGT